MSSEKQSITTSISIEDSLRLSGKHLLGVLNPEDHYLPYWDMAVEENYEAIFKRWWPAHNIGRWLDAMLPLEAVLGVEIPEKIDAAMQENARRFFENPDHISLNPSPSPLYLHTDDEGWIWDLHSLREGMLALNALVRYRKSAWAAEMGRKMVRSLDAKLRDDGTWDLDRFDVFHKRGERVIHNLQPSDTHGRMLEALIWFFEATKDADVLRFADRIAQWHFVNTTNPEGTIPATARADHTHSYFGTLRGLLLYGQLTHQHQYIERVATAYRVTVPKVVFKSGYTSHNMVDESFGETTSPGDAAQLALWLALEGYSEFLDDADRLVRARILPSQIRATPALIPKPGFGNDATSNLGERILGGYGGCHRHPHGGKRAVTDVTCADVHTLTDIYKHIAVPEGSILKVLFHLDFEDSRVRVESVRETRAELSITLKQDTAVAIRVPQWTPRESVQLTSNGQVLDPIHVGHFAWIGMQTAGTRLVMTYDLPKLQTQERGLGKECEIYWRGDDVLGIQPNTGFYPFYPDAPL